MVRAVDDDPSLADSWDRIIVPEDIKSRLLNHALLAIGLRSRGIGNVGLPLHGLALLTGQPGVGKTTLARGLGAEIYKVIGGSYGQVRVVDINLHVLPSELLGRTQRNIAQLFQEELPELAANGPIVVVLDEVEVLAVSRSEMSLDINPADVFRGTAALLSGLDWVARSVPGAFIVGTTNLPGALDDAFRSRADLILQVPTPSPAVIKQILADTLRELAKAFPACSELATMKELDDIAQLLDGCDGRQVRKFVAEGLASTRETALDPSALTIDFLVERAKARSAEAGVAV